MEPRIETVAGKILIGKRRRMSFAEDKTGGLWQEFMPRRSEIKNKLNGNLYSVEVYDPLFFLDFSPEAQFEKWAAAEVTEIDTVPVDMEILQIPAGMYAVFLHRGAAAAGSTTYKYIFSTWLPGSSYILDPRPHFAVMGEKYKGEHPESEEDIYIPVRQA